MAYSDLSTELYMELSTDQRPVHNLCIRGRPCAGAGVDGKGRRRNVPTVHTYKLWKHTVVAIHTGLPIHTALYRPTVVGIHTVLDRHTVQASPSLTVPPVVGLTGTPTPLLGRGLEGGRFFALSGRDFRNLCSGGLCIRPVHEGLGVCMKSQKITGKRHDIISAMA